MKDITPRRRKLPGRKCKVKSYKFLEDKNLDESLRDSYKGVNIFKSPKKQKFSWPKTANKSRWTKEELNDKYAEKRKDKLEKNNSVKGFEEKEEEYDKEKDKDEKVKDTNVDDDLPATTPNSPSLNGAYPFSSDLISRKGCGRERKKTGDESVKKTNLDDDFPPTTPNSPVLIHQI